jgi:CRISPR-associated protein Cmr4
MNTRLLFVHALSPLHAGTGQGIDVIDLPVAREKATGLPFLPGSSLKGTLRAGCLDKTMQSKVFGSESTRFGPESASETDYAGSVQFTDQRLLLLPIRSIAGTFAWITSPYILRRLLRDGKNVNGLGAPANAPIPAENGCVVSDQGCEIALNNQVVLEDLDLPATPNSLARQWAQWIAERVFPPGDTVWQQMLVGRFAVVHDDVLSFLLDTATEITARVKLLEEAKTVKKGGLWYEEALPTETILSGLVVATPVKATRDEVFTTVTALMDKPIQFGGKATVGRGLCRLQMTGGN